MAVRSVSPYNVYIGRGSVENVPFPVMESEGVTPGKVLKIYAVWCILWIKYAFTGSRAEV